MGDTHLKQVYDLETAEDLRAHYDAWAKEYDADLAANGYVTPARCAAALAASALPKDAAILDMGCGTGLSGDALAQAGFTVIDGADVSDGMLDEARARGIYRQLINAETTDIAPGQYAAIVAAGVIGPGAAEPRLFDHCLELLQPGGLFCFSFNDHAAALPAYGDKRDNALSTGKAGKLFEAHGPHIPKLDVGAFVYILEKL